MPGMATKCLEWMCMFSSVSVADGRTPDNSKFASCGGDKAVFLWDVASGTVIRRMAAHVSKVNAVAFAGVDTSILVSGKYREACEYKGLSFR
jgi:WD40 repeat protein